MDSKKDNNRRQLLVMMRRLRRLLLIRTFMDDGIGCFIEKDLGNDPENVSCVMDDRTVSWTLLVSACHERFWKDSSPLVVSACASRAISHQDHDAPANHFVSPRVPTSSHLTSDRT